MANRYWSTTAKSWPGHVQLTSPGLCTALTARVYNGRCVNKAIKGFKVLPLSLCGLVLPLLSSKMY